MKNWAPAPAAEKKAVPATDKNASDLININRVTADQLKTLPGTGDAYADEIFKEPPYKMKTKLKSKKIIPASTYDKIAGMIIAKQE